MPISEYMRDLRDAVGSRLVLVPAVAAIIRNEADRILVLRKAEDGRWSLPAGAIDPGESPREAVQREVVEETGLEVGSARLIAALGGESFRTRYPNGDEVEFTVCVFECEVVEGQLVARDGEAEAFQWAEPVELIRLLDLPYPAALFEG